MAEVGVAQPQGLEGYGESGLQNSMETWFGVGAESIPVLPSSCLSGSYRSQEPYGTLVFVAVRGSEERKRRRQLRASIFALALPLSLSPGWVLWATMPKASGPIQGPQRKLLESLLQVRLSQLAVSGHNTG